MPNLDPGAVLAALRHTLQAMTFAEAIGYVGVVLSITGSSMRTMIPLRCFNVATNSVFIAYGLLAGVYPTLVAHLVLLPMNSYRLVQMLRLVRQVRRASAGDLSMDWLKPFMNRRATRAGAPLFRRGDEADCLFFTMSGRYRLAELGLDVGPGQVVGELGVLAPDGRRTQTLECLEAGEVLAITYGELRELYFQNPEFGFYFLRLTSGRLFENVAGLEREVARLRGLGRAA
jgi:CRP/FNR family transcriptional regulator, cyclic AMP receptor protein